MGEHFIEFQDIVALLQFNTEIIDRTERRKDSIPFIDSYSFRGESHNQCGSQLCKLLRPSPRTLLRPDGRQRLHSSRDILEPCFRKDPVHAIHKKPPMFRVRAISGRDETHPNQSVRSHLIRCNPGDKPLQALQQLPLVLVSGHSAEVDPGGFYERHSSYVEDVIVFGVGRKVVLDPVEIVVER